MQLENEAEDARPGAVATDPVARPLLIARSVCAALWLIPLGLATLMPLMGLDWRVTPEGAGFMLLVFSFLGVVNLVAGGLIYFFGTRSANNPVALGIICAVATALMNGIALLGFVASISSQSSLPFLVALVPTVIGWAVVWPRRSVWRRQLVPMR